MKKINKSDLGIAIVGLVMIIVFVSIIIYGATYSGYDPMLAGLCNASFLGIGLGVYVFGVAVLNDNHEQKG